MAWEPECCNLETVVVDSYCHLSVLNTKTVQSASVTFQDSNVAGEPQFLYQLFE